MTNKKKHKDIPGQRPLTGLPQAIEASSKTKLPKGMPTLDVLKTELARRGFGDGDADYLYDAWLANGFKTGRGVAIKDWQASMRLWIRNGYLPSQKKAARVDESAADKQSLELARIRRLKREQR